MEPNDTRRPQHSSSTAELPIPLSLLALQNASSTTRLPATTRKVKLPAGDTIESNEQIQIPYKIKTFRAELRARIPPINEYDVILGLDWFRQWNPDFDWPKNVIHIQQPKSMAPNEPIWHQLHKPTRIFALDDIEEPQLTTITIDEVNEEVDRGGTAFGVEEVEFCEHIIRRGQIRPMASKMEVIQSWPTPRTVHHVRQFLGLASCYRRFVRGFVKISAPLSELLEENDAVLRANKHRPTRWTASCALAFERLKECLTNSPVLAQIDPHRSLLKQTHPNGLLATKGSCQVTQRQRRGMEKETRFY